MRSLVAIVVVAVSAPAAAEVPEPMERSESPAARPGDLGVGLAVGQPTRLVVKYLLPDGLVGLEAGLGTGVIDNLGLHADLSASANTEVGPVMLSAGAGLRFERHRFEPASVDETGADSHLGVRLIGAVAQRLSSAPIDLFAEIAPGIDLARSSSCALISGAMSVCAHDGDSRLFLHVGVGARYWLDL